MLQIINHIDLYKEKDAMNQLAWETGLQNMIRNLQNKGVPPEIYLQLEGIAEIVRSGITEQRLKDVKETLTKMIEAVRKLD